MSIRDKEKNLLITDGVTGETIVVEHFFDYSSYTQCNIVDDLVMPILLDKQSVFLKIVYKD